MSEGVIERSRPDVYNEIFTYAKEYITSNSIYSPTIQKAAPTETSTFPLVVIPECTLQLNDETLCKSEREYELSFEIEIYSINITSSTTIARQTVVEELEKLVYDVFEEHYGMRGLAPEIRPNADTNVMRLYIKFEGTINENKIIFRR